MTFLEFKKVINEYQNPIFLWVLFAKLCFAGLTLTDCLGALIILVTIQAVRVIDYLFPKRPNLFNELSLVQDQINIIKSKSEELEHDVTSLKFGISQKR